MPPVPSWNFFPAIIPPDSADVQLLHLLNASLNYCTAEWALLAVQLSKGSTEKAGVFLDLFLEIESIENFNLQLVCFSFLLFFAFPLVYLPLNALALPKSINFYALPTAPMNFAQVALTALYIASKTLDPWPPTLRQLAEFSDWAFTIAELLSMELRMRGTLKVFLAPEASVGLLQNLHSAMFAAA